MSEGNEVNLKELWESGCGKKIMRLKNRLPKMTVGNEYIMDFGGKNVLPSVKNTIM